jgi:4,5:9,10-diseco-3-hydroxy-5,9,17-trioxoandrosta-1(10),2-diene-4-oate hydrolase
MNKLFALLTLTGCAPALRTLPVGPPARLALSAPDPGALHRVLGVDLWVHDSDSTGGKPALVCLHAIGHGGGDFTALSKALPEWRVIAVDFPGHGRSGDDSEPASAIRYEQLVDGLMDALQLERVVVLGNSIGGATAIRLAAARPGRIRALVLANPGGLDPGGSSLIGRFFIGNLVGHFERGARNEARFGAWFREYYADILPAAAAAQQRERIVASGYEHAALLAQAWTSFMQPEASLAPLIDKVTMPVLFAWADQDRIVSWSRSEAAVKRFSNARVVHFEAGHSAFLEQPDSFLVALRAFLREVQ